MLQDVSASVAPSIDRLVVAEFSQADSQAAVRVPDAIWPTNYAVAEVIWPFPSQPTAGFSPEKTAVASPPLVAAVHMPEESFTSAEPLTSPPGAASLSRATLESGQGPSPTRGPLVAPGSPVLAEVLCGAAHTGGPDSSSTPLGPHQ